MIFDSNMQAALNSGNVIPRWFVYLQARNRTTGNPESIAVWTGLGDLTVNGRTYQGAGGVIGLDGISYNAGLEIGSQTINVTFNDPNITTLIRVYDPSFSNAEIHLGLFDPNTEELIGTTRAFAGTIDNVQITDALDVRIELVGSMRHGSRQLTGKQSDADQRQRDPDDRGREYGAIAGEIVIHWGMAASKK